MLNRLRLRNGQDLLDSDVTVFCSKIIYLGRIFWRTLYIGVRIKLFPWVAVGLSAILDLFFWNLMVVPVVIEAWVNAEKKHATDCQSFVSEFL